MTAWGHDKALQQRRWSQAVALLCMLWWIALFTLLASSAQAQTVVSGSSIVASQRVGYKSIVFANRQQALDIARIPRLVLGPWGKRLLR